jgi:hypothetical protein
VAFVTNHMKVGAAVSRPPSSRQESHSGARFSAIPRHIERSFLPTYLNPRQNSERFEGRGHTMRTLAIQRFAFITTAAAILFVGAIVVGLI